MPGSMPVRPAPWHEMQAGMPFFGSPAVASACPLSRLAAIRGHGLVQHERRTLLRVVLGDLAQVSVRKIRDEVIHRRVTALAVAKRDELVIEITGGLAGDAREVIVARALAALAMTGGAALDAGLHGIERLECRDCRVLRERLRGGNEPRACDYGAERTCEKAQRILHH